MAVVLEVKVKGQGHVVRKPFHRITAIGCCDHCATAAGVELQVVWLLWYLVIRLCLLWLCSMSRRPVQVLQHWSLYSSIIGLWHGWWLWWWVRWTQLQWVFRFFFILAYSCCILFNVFLPHDAMLARNLLSSCVCLSVCPFFHPSVKTLTQSHPNFYILR